MLGNFLIACIEATLLDKDDRQLPPSTLVLVKLATEYEAKLVV